MAVAMIPIVAIRKISSLWPFSLLGTILVAWFCLQFKMILFRRRLFFFAIQDFAGLVLALLDLTRP